MFFKKIFQHLSGSADILLNAFVGRVSHLLFGGLDPRNVTHGQSPACFHAHIGM